MTLKKVIAATALVMLASVGAQAQDKKAPGSGPNPYTDCGIGAALFKEPDWAAVTSNVIWDLGTTALISATASPETCQGKSVKAAIFIKDTYETLAEEAAKGQGEHLTAVLNIMECPASTHAAAIQSVRTSMGAAVAQPGYASQPRLDKTVQFYQAVHAASKSCSV